MQVISKKKMVRLLITTVLSLLCVAEVRAEETCQNKATKKAKDSCDKHIKEKWRCHDSSTCIDYCFDDGNKEKILNKMKDIAESNNYLCYVNRLDEINIAQIGTTDGKGKRNERLKSHYQRCYTNSSGPIILQKSRPGKSWEDLVTYSSIVFQQFVVDIGGPQAAGNGWDYRFVKQVSDSRVDPGSWMEETFAGSMGDKKLRDICIPGTHDSGTSPINVFLAPLARTQKLKILEQLERGARYLDLRVKTISGTWYTHHSVIKGEKLESVLDDIFHFFNPSRKEIGIIKLDIKGGDEKEDALYDLVLGKLGELAIPRPESGASVKISELWNDPKQGNLIFLSKQETEPKRDKKIWGFDNINDQWPEKGVTPKLQKALEGFAEGTRPGEGSDTLYAPANNQFWVPQVVLTPTSDSCLHLNIKIATNELDRGAMLYYVNRLSRAKFGDAAGINIALVDFYGDDDDNTFDACMHLNKGVL